MPSGMKRRLQGEAEHGFSVSEGESCCSVLVEWPRVRWQGRPGRAVLGTGMGVRMGTVPLLLLVEPNLVSSPLAGCTGKAELGLLHGTVAASL